MMLGVTLRSMLGRKLSLAMTVLTLALSVALFMTIERLRVAVRDSFDGTISDLEEELNLFAQAMATVVRNSASEGGLLRSRDGRGDNAPRRSLVHRSETSERSRLHDCQGRSKRMCASCDRP